MYSAPPSERQFVKTSPAPRLYCLPRLFVEKHRRGEVAGAADDY